MNFDIVRRSYNVACAVVSLYEAMMETKRYAQPGWWLLFLGGVYVSWQWHVGRSGMADFRVYFDAASLALKGSSPYGQAFGVSSGFYKYAPVALVPFLPLVALGWFWARWVYWGILLVGLAWGLPRLVDGIGRRLGHSSPSPGMRSWVMVGLAIIGSHHLGRELLLGNINALLLLALGVWWSWVGRSGPAEAVGGRAVAGGALMGLVWAFKPHFLVLLPWMMVRKPPIHAVLSVVAFGVALLLPALGLGWSTNLAWLQDWWETIRMHNTDTSHSANTLSAMLGLSSPWSTLLTAASLGAWGGWVLWGKFRSINRDRPFWEAAAGVALLPNWVHTDTEHFLWSLPWVAVWLWRLADARAWEGTGSRWRWVVGAVLVLCCIPYTTGTPDLWGRELAAWLERGGALGWANVVLVLGGLWLALGLPERRPSFARPDPNEGVT